MKSIYIEKISTDKTNTNRMIASIPITNHYGKITIWGSKWYLYYSAIIYDKAPITASCSLKIEGREVEKATNLILHLKLVSPVPLGRNRTVRAQNPILPGTTPLLNPVPGSHIQV